MVRLSNVIVELPFGSVLENAMNIKCSSCGSVHGVLKGAYPSIFVCPSCIPFVNMSKYFLGLLLKDEKLPDYLNNSVVAYPLKDKGFVAYDERIHKYFKVFYRVNLLNRFVGFEIYIPKKNGKTKFVYVPVSSLKSLSDKKYWK